MNPPVIKDVILPSESRLLRFNDIEDLFYYDIPENNPRGISIDRRNNSDVKEYIKTRSILTKRKQDIITLAQSEIEKDEEFLKLVYQGKSQKRKQNLNKFVGNLSMVQFAKGDEKLFLRGEPGKKKQILNLAFQVGTFLGGNYEEAFKKILKTIIMCQAMNISVNIDMFDSDTQAIDNKDGYIIVNVSRSCEKINFKKIMVASHPSFFNYTLFNGYSASEKQRSIGTFLSSSKIIQDLSPYYDVIGGNLLSERDGMISKILKIGLKIS